MRNPFKALAAGLVLLASCGAQPSTSKHPRMPEIERATVAILCPVPLSTDGEMLIPCCAGFMIEAPIGPVLVTAKHCVAAAGSSRVPYVSHSAWNNTTDDFSYANLVASYDDVALLVPASAPEAVLSVGLLNEAPGAQVLAVRLDEAVSGEIKFSTRTTLDVVKGWSGSPVLQNGKVVAVLIECRAKVDNDPCLPNSGIFQAL